MQTIFIKLDGQVPANGRGGQQLATLAFPDHCQAVKNLLHPEAVVYAILRYHLKPGSVTTTSVVFSDDQHGAFGKWIGSLPLRTSESLSIELGLIIFDSMAEACADFELAVQGDLLNQADVRRSVGEVAKRK